ncbi:hypothetical protein RvY_08977 [Ramazzottius varieornatus]|uniref:Sugar phosphate transporter domain-containing protein n=1 Tax=Ramazzottius varieornatus TaxID=947166 RepID=A0A1D1V7Q7_RAMVA|nr:hypothetical protein RvY_08977 [Ramazzottius varieornatus]
MDRNADGLKPQQPSRTVILIRDRALKKTKSLAVVADVGIRDPHVLLMLLSWYFFSGVTLFLNKIVLSAVPNSAALLGAAQISVTTGCSFIQLYYPCGMWKRTRIKPIRPPNFWRIVFLVGTFRYLTVWLGLVALDYVAVSFAETVKCSAPLFTVIISRLVVGEVATLPVILSLVPVMGGLALCSAHELSFNLIGFLASLGTNVSECLQSVYSKLLVSGDNTQCNPAELQFYSGFASLIFIIPTTYYALSDTFLPSLDFTLLIWYLIDGISFHFQSITANVLMGYLSPTTYSVSNTVKRALLIWCSILVFGNPVSLGAWIGTFLMLIGILLYNRAKTAVVRSVAMAD